MALVCEETEKNILKYPSEIQLHSHLLLALQFLLKIHTFSLAILDRPKFAIHT